MMRLPPKVIPLPSPPDEATGWLALLAVLTGTVSRLDAAPSSSGSALCLGFFFFFFFLDFFLPSPEVVGWTVTGSSSTCFARDDAAASLPLLFVTNSQLLSSTCFCFGARTFDFSSRFGLAGAVTTSTSSSSDSSSLELSSIIMAEKTAPPLAFFFPPAATSPHLLLGFSPGRIHLLTPSLPFEPVIRARPDETPPPLRFDLPNWLTNFLRLASTLAVNDSSSSNQPQLASSNWAISVSSSSFSVTARVSARVINLPLALSSIAQSGMTFLRKALILASYRRGGGYCSESTGLIFCSCCFLASAFFSRSAVVALLFSLIRALIRFSFNSKM
mmetsp:Transcript_4537/g.10168  ORF Transcript_4537/g.10168 Transcript_4537/m.10168 type:complete len:331 (-) Transcript_4537:651-1643(-)